MALANFFDRAAMAASQVLSGFDVAAFTERLETHLPGVAFDGVAIRSAEGRATIDLCVRLLTRLYPAIALAALDDVAKGAIADFASLATDINPQIEIQDGIAGASACIAIGDTVPSAACPVIFAGSNGWTALMSRSRPVGCGYSSTPLGAGAAACFAAANVFRMVFADQMSAGYPDDEIALSLLTYDQGPSNLPSGPDGAIALGDVHIVGLGAIGNGVMWALARSPGVTGTVHVVDHEGVDLPNLQRYVSTTQRDVGRPKVEVAEAILSRPGLDVIAHEDRWADYVAGRGDWAFDMVAVALDTARDRIAVQGSLPRRIVNAWTQDLDLGVSRHGFGDGRPCLACLYLPSGKVKDEDERLAEELRMPEARLEIRRLLQTGHPLDEAFVLRVTATLALPVDALAAFVGQPLRSLHQVAICGGLAFKLTRGTTKVGAVVPMAFQSALAGIMLAADLVRHAAGLPVHPAASTRINLLRPLAPFLHDPRSRDGTGRCICGDDDYLAAYRRKYEGDVPPVEAVRSDSARRARRGRQSGPLPATEHPSRKGDRELDGSPRIDPLPGTLDAPPNVTPRSSNSSRWRDRPGSKRRRP